MVITNLTARVRSGALILGAAATLGLSACGGDDSSKKDYQASLNSFCDALLTKQKSLEGDVQAAASSAGSDPAKAATALGDVLGDYGTTLKTEIGKLGEADVPSEYKDFNDKLTKGINDVAGIATTTAGKLKEIDLSGVAKGDTSGLTELQGALTDLSKQSNPLENLEAPKELKEGAPKCDELSKS
ncbi:hypothetical protein [Paraconexibacter sp.]|uniref:hypothetical protein n=1 Tax=Paraconexibacter sp. TaxID=2949640 RepID=UPI0035633ADA